MVDIYNEVAFIKNVLGGNFSYKWERDMRLLVRFYHNEGILRKGQVREKMKEKLINSNVGYCHELEFKKFNNIFKQAWDDKKPLRQIQYIEFTKEVLDWFLNLIDMPEFKLTDEQVEYYKKRRKVVIKNNKALNWDRVKFLFTIYIYTLIELNYNDNPGFFKLGKRSTQKRFKHDAKLTSYNITKEDNYMLDLGLIKITGKQSVVAKFIDDYEVFKIPITDENRVVIYAGEPPEGELYNIGDWLDKKKFGTFVCQKCGKEFAHYNSTSREMARKYCKECASEVKNKKNPLDNLVANKIYAKRVCECCGEVYVTNPRDNKSKLCNKCQDKKNKEIKRIYQEKYRTNHKKWNYHPIIKKPSKPLKNQRFSRMKMKNDVKLIVNRERNTQQN